MSDLNPRQREAVRHLDGPLLVLAGAGSGKTRVIAHKIAHLVRAAGYAPEHVAAVTFTNKAAREMAARVGRLVERGVAGKLRVSTFHTLGLRILRVEHARVGRRPGFSIYDEADAVGLVADCLRGQKRALAAEADAVRGRVSRRKCAGLAPDDPAPSAEPLDVLARAVHGPYDEALAACNAVDFDDLIALPVRLLRGEAAVTAAWRERIRYLLVDEYQDTNLAQYELVRLLVGERARLTVVGDDDQSIYGWRGAHPENLAALARDFPGLRVVKLEQNYRSAGTILKAANALIERNPHVFAKRLWSERGPGERLRVAVAGDEDEEAIMVASRILAHRMASGGRWADYAVLYRGNHQSRPIERALRERNVPYALSGGPSFFDYTEVKDVMAYLRLLANPDDDNAFLRIANTPRRELGAATLATLATLAAQADASLYATLFRDDLDGKLGARAATRVGALGALLGPLAARAAAGDDPARILADLLEGCDFRGFLRDSAPDPATAARRVGNVDDLAGWLARLGAETDGPATLAEVVARLALTDVLERENEDDAGDRVRLLTLHAAKGLEFRHVYLVGMEENLLPHRTSIEEDAIAEERRLAYVGITRAQDTLTFTLARRRRRFGGAQSCVPSRFLDELPRDLLEWPGESADPAAAQARGRATLAGLREHLRREPGKG